MMTIQFKTLRDLEVSQEELAQWADSANTTEVVALAIHAIADDSRTADQIWEDPTPAEYDQVVMAVQNYVENGLYDADDEYHWGIESFELPTAESPSYDFGYRTIEQVAERVTDGPVQGFEHLTSEYLAAAYALEACQNEPTEEEVEAHLEALANAGAEFNHGEALRLSIK